MPSEASCVLSAPSGIYHLFVVYFSISIFSSKTGTRLSRQYSRAQDCAEGAELKRTKKNEVWIKADYHFSIRVDHCLTFARRFFLYISRR